MRVALISDIHGNLVALDTVLEDISRRSVNQILCLGDVASTGPQPRETIDRVRSLNCPVVMGNADAELLVSPPEASALWYWEQLSEEHLDYLRSLQPTVDLLLGDGAMMRCFHGSPRSYNDLITATTPSADLEEMLSACQATVLAGGHSHVQMIRRHKDMMIINPGSVGLPYDMNPWTNEVPKESVRLAPWSEYAIVTYDNGRFGVELLRVPLDVEAVKGPALVSGWPLGQSWAESWRT